ncbi:DUF3152 domain-containing protein [Streptomyces sp. CWNU-52B]|uniref:DUF3152 domain-containing protein n=1 Tax=unclassified Streptomyces TaxID=2593676 RepID=UPI0039BFAA00
MPDGTPAQGSPVQGAPRRADGTPAHGTPRVRGGHPEQREPGGGWGETRAGTAGHGGSQAFRQGPQQGPGGRPAAGGRYAAATGGPRQAYVDAFSGDDDTVAPRTATATAAALRADPFAPVADRDEETGHKASPSRGPKAPEGGSGSGPDAGAGNDGEDDDKDKGGKGRAFTGIAAAAVITVLAVVVAGQVADGGGKGSAGTQAAGGANRGSKDSVARTDKRSVPSTKPSVATLSYAQQMAVKYPLAADLEGGRKFEAVPGLDKAPGKGRKYTYRVDVEKALGLDGELFAQAVQKTLNDQRSWAHDGGRTFERISSGKPDFVITLASPGTTAFWCAKSGLDTTQDNVSCDSAATDRVMINAYRWAQGSETYGDKMYAYRQMLINHEVGHRLGFGHVSCSVDGGLAPVMQQQTKFLNHDGITCRPNPWPFPGK